MTARIVIGHQPSHRGAGMAGTFGQELRRHREAAGLSQPALARLVHFSQSAISKAESGALTPSREFADACDEALTAQGVLAALIPGRRITPAEDLEAWEIIDTLTRASISHQALDHMERTVVGYAQTYPTSTPADLTPAINQQMRRLKDALSRSQPIETRRRCVALVGVLSGLAGNLSLDAGLKPRAQSYFEAGRIASTEANDQDLTAWLLAMESIGPFFDRRPSDAFDLLVAASAVADAASSPRRRAWILALMARANAAMGDREAAHKALGRAAKLLENLNDSPLGTDFFDLARLQGLTGSCYLLLRSTDQAVHLLDAALRTCLRS